MSYSSLVSEVITISGDRTLLNVSQPIVTISVSAVSTTMGNRSPVEDCNQRIEKQWSGNGREGRGNGFIQIKAAMLVIKASEVCPWTLPTAQTAARAAISKTGPKNIAP